MRCEDCGLEQDEVARGMICTYCGQALSKRMSIAARKAAYLAAKSGECLACKAEGRRADWPPEAMCLDHRDPADKLFYPGQVARGRWVIDKGGKRVVVHERAGVFPMPWGDVVMTEELFRAELEKGEPTCMNHHSIDNSTSAKHAAACAVRS